MSLFKELLKRRVPQILGIYLGTSWAIIEFLDWLINHFSISPYLPELGLVILAAMIPTVLMLAYFHGKPGRDRWTRVEKIGIPTNVVTAILLLFFVFKGKDLGATTALVTMENEEGEIVERVIPKPEFRKKIMLYFPVNASCDTSLNWVSYGFTELLSIDLLQDFYLEYGTLDNINSLEDIMGSGYQDLTGLPLMLEKEKAEELNKDYFLTGSITKEGERYSVTTRLYQTRNAKFIDEVTMTSDNLWDLVDQFAIQLKHSLSLPDYHIEEAEDLPVSEISTNSLTALKWYIKGYNAITFNQDWDRARHYLELAVQEDPTFALAYFTLYRVYLLNNQSDQGAYLFEPLMNHLYKLPEKMQYMAKASYFEMQRQFDKQYAIFEMLVSLFPEDIGARLNMIEIYKIRNQTDEAIAEYQQILKLDPERYSVFREIGALYEQTGDYELALEYYQKYADHFPDRPESYQIVGDLQKTLGNFQEARSSYEKAIILEPDNTTVLLQMADIESKSGNFNEALQQLENVLEQSTTPGQRAQVYLQMQLYHQHRGELDSALKYLYLRNAEWDRAMIPLVSGASKIGTFNHFVQLVSEEVAMLTMDTLSGALDAIMKDYSSIGYMYLFLESGDTGRAEDEIGKIEGLISELQVEALRVIVLNGRGRIHELKKEYDQAVQYYSEQSELDPNNYDLYIQLGRCYRELGDHKKAEEALGTAIRFYPYSPEANYELALLYDETGKKADAITHLNRALKTWETADPDFEPARIAREMLNKWDPVSPGID